MKKSDFYEIVAKSGHMTKKTAKDAIDTFLGEVVKSLKKGEKVVLSGVGTLAIGKVGPKDVVPFGKAEKRITVKSHHVVNFKVAKPLKRIIW